MDPQGDAGEKDFGKIQENHSTNFIIFASQKSILFVNTMPRSLVSRILIFKSWIIYKWFRYLYLLGRETLSKLHINPNCFKKFHKLKKRLGRFWSVTMPWTLPLSHKLTYTFFIACKYLFLSLFLKKKRLKSHRLMRESFNH